MRIAILAFALVLSIAPAFSQTCVNEADAQAQVKEHSGTWTKMTPNQWQFLRGIYALNPETPPGLPPGDRAALASRDGGDSIVFFIDEGQICEKMRAPKELTDLLDAVKSGKISHIGNPL